jgi:hypothetical protein
MSKGNHKFKQSEVVRAIKAARAAGCDVLGFEVDGNGTLRVLFKGEGAEIKQTDSGSEWDTV